MSLCADPETAPDAEGLREALHEELLKTFKPAFLGRLTLVPYFPLDDAVMAKIIELKLAKIGNRIRESYRAEFSYAPELVASVAERCHEVETGARNIDHILTRGLLPDLSAEFLSRTARGEAIAKVHISVDKSGFNYDIQ
jgi:type VI secretion system protein VasG